MATILIVDDEASIRSLICLALGANHILLEAGSGQEGLSLFLLYNPDLIITDLNMPGMNGVELVKRIRALSGKVKIIAHFTIQNPQQQAAMMSAGADLCLAKPATITEIEEAVAKLLP